MREMSVVPMAFLKDFPPSSFQIWGKRSSAIDEFFEYYREMLKSDALLSFILIQSDISNHLLLSVAKGNGNDGRYSNLLKVFETCRLDRKLVATTKVTKSAQDVHTPSNANFLLIHDENRAANELIF